MSTNKKNLLVFIEPHPLRNSVTEFVDAGRLLASLVSEMEPSEVDWRIFSNDFVLEELTRLSIPEDKLIAPTASESEYIASSLVEWTAEEVDNRTLLVNGDGDVAHFYQDVLRRIREEYAFDIILLWSENGAVRRFADQTGISVLHMELGPTRAPFQETVYIDFRGTNGSASFLEFDLEAYPKEDVLPVASWVALSAAFEENKPSIMELQAVTPSLASDFMKPYVVVALQLADDLNTICHSRFRSPKEFLEFVLPALLGLGFKVLLKGHPGSPARPTNLVEEIAAIEYAESFGDDVIIVDRHLTSTEFIPILSNAAAVCSINSSVSFEAILLGVPGLVFGKAVYDPGSVLRHASDDFLRSGRWPLGAFEIDRLVTVLCRHLFHPKVTQPLAKILQEIVSRITPGMTAKEYARILASVASHGYAIIDDEMDKTRLQVKLTELAKSLEPIDSSYMGHIDDVVTRHSPHGMSLSVKGWVARRGAYPQVKMIALCDATGNVMGFTELFDRVDVRKVHKHITYPVGFSVASAVPSSASGSEGLRLVMVTDSGAVSCAISKGGLKTHLAAVSRETKQRRFSGLLSFTLPFLRRAMRV